MTRAFQERMRVISQAPVNIYIPSNHTRYWYPYRLQHVGYAAHPVRDECLSYIMDSGIGNEDVTNEDVLNKAHEFGANYVVPKDYLHDQDRTTDSVHEFHQLYDDHPCTARPLIPLQPPYDKHYRCLEEHAHYVLGGIAMEDPETQLAEIRKFRRVAGCEVYAHALGMGASLTIIRALRENPQLLDSLDVSTPEQVTKNGKLPDRTWKQRQFEIPSGEDSSTVRAAFTEAVALQLNYMLTPMCEDDLLESAFEQSTFLAYGES